MLLTVRCLLQACAAYSFITIPSLQSVYSQLQLYLVSGQVALLNQCFSQGWDQTPVYLTNTEIALSALIDCVVLIWSTAV